MNAMTPTEPETERQRIIIKGRNRALALVLFGLAALFFAITIVKRLA